jgi:putative SOS response-associated peptidase YedK
MCVNFIPPSRQMLVDYFHVDLPDRDWPAETWPDYPAPFITTDGQGGRHAQVGTYGMVPKSKIPPHVKKFDTMNARHETVGQLRSFKDAWQQTQLCLVPMMGFFEPCYESGKAIRWQIGMGNGAPMAVAGLWRSWEEPDGSVSHSFTQLTVNAESHPLLRRMHKPGDEKRSLVVIPPSDYDHWLNSGNPELARTFMKLYPSELMRGWPDPIPSNPPKKKPPEPTLSLF